MRLILAVFLCIGTVACDIYSCGGFVRSKAPIDYSKIQVKLLTPEGHLKHEEDVNPQNGYYMIPVYNKGQYSLKVSAPEGWYFAPDTYDFKLDGLTDPCSKNEDINFSLTAFSIEGVVESGSAEGPIGLDLTLRTNGEEISSTKTTAGGKYAFRAPPGKYEVAAGADSSVCISRGKVSFEVKNAPIIVTPALKVSGYELEVAVTNNGKSVADVGLFMYAAINPELPGCEGMASTSKEASAPKFLCPLGKTATSGNIRVSCVPSGAYFIRPEFEKDGINFQFTPATLGLIMKNEKTKVSFSVAGFSARGLVKVAGAPVAGAHILLNGMQVTTTDSKGAYTLSGLKEGNIELTARASHTQFDTVKTQLKLPVPSIPVINVNGYEICGSAEQTSGSTGSISFIVKNKANGETTSIRTDASGKFCKMLRPAEYTIAPADSTSSLTPRNVDVNLSQGPHKDLRFTHFKTDLEARVDCIGACDGLQLQLILGDSIISTVKGADSFLFKDIAPGKYVVKLLDSGRFCWVEPTMSLNVERVRPAPITFEQQGFNTHVKLSHPATVKWTHADRKHVNGVIEAAAGKNTICVPIQGKYQFVISSCRTFDRSVLDVQVPSDAVAETSALDALIKGSVVSKDKSEIKILVKSSAGEHTVPVVNGVFSFQEELRSTGDLVLVPQSETHLFDPASFVLNFKGDCVEKAVEFTAHKGIFIDGQISPPVEGVKITAQHNHDKNVKFVTNSDKSGKYRVGPVRRIEDLSISAVKEGYSFTPIDGEHGKLTSVRLSKLTVAISELAGEGGRLDGVLLSVVGGREYRSNNMVDATGEINFVGLAPGDYFLRPILQEFKFEPSQTTVTVMEGEHQHVELKGRRYAYSAFGRVREMSGSAVSDALVEALSEKCGHHQSEANTGQDGSFRIRGLKPDCEYKVSLKSGPDGAPSPHCFPSQFVVKMTAEHVKSLEMVVAPSDEGFELLVDVDFGTLTPPQSVKLTLFKGEEILTTSSLVSPVHVFAVSNLTRDNSEYSIRLEAEKPPQMFAPVEKTFLADVPVRTISIPITASRKQSEIEISLTSLLALLLVFVSAWIFFNLSKTMTLVSAFLALITPGERPNSPNQNHNKKKRN